MAGRRVGMIRVREYGTQGPLVVVLHGGPGAPGTMAPVARALADSFRVLEPLQRTSGGAPLTVAQHVADLDEVILAKAGADRPTVVGHSWGAMLALAHAAVHPRRVKSLVLVGCGTFDTRSRAALQANREARIDATLRGRLERIVRDHPEADDRLRVLGEAMLSVDSYDLDVEDLELESCDARGHRETWVDAMRLQAEGTHPAAFAAIECPVLLLHGTHDPHPGRGIRDVLAAHVRRLTYREIERCGHVPWLERSARDEFFATLRSWLRGADGGSIS